MDEMIANAPNEPPAKRRRLSTGSDIHIQTSQKQLSYATDPADNSPPNHVTNREEELGIDAYVNEGISSFSGYLKTRYSDFVVNEILPNGEVVHLQNTRASKERLQHNEVIREEIIRPTPLKAESSPQPQPATNGAIEQVQEKPTDVSVEEVAAITEEQRTQLVEYLNETAANELINLYQSIKLQPYNKRNIYPTVRTEFTTDRSIRGKIHQFIRETFNSTIESSTDKEGVLVLTASRSNASKSNGWNKKPQSQSQPQRSNKQSWQERGGDYVHFTLYKENKDTMEAVSWIAKQLRSNPKSFQFAGTKDKRAITTQRCSAYRIEPEKLAAQNYSLRGSKIGDFSYHQQGLELGDLGGNEFTITLRECQFPDSLSLETIEEEMKSRLSSLQQLGYINYYGEQRFGTFNIRTDTIGLHILQGNFAAACDAILAYPESSLAAAQSTETETRIGQDDRNRALAIYNWRQDNRLNEALDILPRKFSAEAALMRHLSRHPNDYLNALLTIQRNLRLMYVHAYQSLVWNKAASNRIKTHGINVVEGDLVLVNEHKDKQQDPSTNTTTTNQTTSDNDFQPTDADGEVIIQPAAHDRATDTNDIFSRARPLTATEASSGQYTIFDIVLPQPGFDIIYPANSTGDFYKSYMNSDEGGGLDPNDMRRKHRDFSLSGAYRKVVGWIGEKFWCEVRRYESVEEQFVRTDLEELEGRRKENRKEVSDHGGVMNADDNETGSASVTENGIKIEGEKSVDEKMENGGAAEAPAENDKETGKGSKIAVILNFQLGASQYATMALREFSKGGIVQYKPDFSGGR